MLLKNGVKSSASEIEELARELSDFEVHCKDGRLVLWYRPLLAAWSPLLRFAHFNKLSKIAKNTRALLFACGEASSIHLPDFSESQVNK